MEKKPDFIRLSFFSLSHTYKQLLRTSHTFVFFIDQSENTTIVSVLFVLSQKRHDDSRPATVPSDKKNKKLLHVQDAEWNR